MHYHTYLAAVMRPAGNKPDETSVISNNYMGLSYEMMVSGEDVTAIVQPDEQ